MIVRYSCVTGQEVSWSTGMFNKYTTFNHAQVAEPLLPYALAFAAGAMVYVVTDDIIPEAHSR